MRACSGTPGGCGCTSSRRSPTSPAASASTPTARRAGRDFDPSATRRSCSRRWRAAPSCGPSRGAARRSGASGDDPCARRGLGRCGDGAGDRPPAEVGRCRRGGAPPAGGRRTGRVRFRDASRARAPPPPASRGRSDVAALTDAVGAETRDALWSHPDLVPTSADIDDPQALIARLTAGVAGVRRHRPGDRRPAR